MSTLFKIAWRNVWRHWQRTLITLITMMVGLGIFVAMDSMLKGMDATGLETIINLSDSSLRVSTKAYEEERGSLPLDYGITNLVEVEKSLRENSRVVAVAPRTRFIGELSTGIDSIPVMAVAVDPIKDAEVFSLSEHLEGLWLDGLVDGNGDSHIVLGYKLARDLGVGVGDYITLFARTRYESQNADAFLVTGLLDTDDPNINFTGVFISFQDAEPFLDLEGLRTELTVRMERRINLDDAMADSDALAAEIVAAYPELEALSFGEIGRSFLELAAMKSKFTTILILIILLIAGVGIANTLLMSVYSRIREIGVLRAFGFKAKEIRRLFIIEGAIIGAVGSLAGMGFGIYLDYLLIRYGFPIGAFIGDTNMGIPVGDVLYGEWNPSLIIGAGILGIAIAIFASRSPAKRASKLEVTEALRFN
ncbi:MAG TPA: FtsX-like permease family protein [Treponemataceae bacterium]|nr:FtsX-like permease family protein [Treponemataceae bacterium]